MSQYPLPQPVIVARTKSVALSLVLTFFFGPLGMLYSTVWGAIFMILFSCVAFFFTFGHGLIFTWPFCMIWGAWATHRYNERLLRRAGL